MDSNSSLLGSKDYVLICDTYGDSGGIMAWGKADPRGSSESVQCFVSCQPSFAGPPAQLLPPRNNQQSLQPEDCDISC